MADDAPPGVPEWVVTYGDMMSLLLTFFIMLVSLSEISGEQKYQRIIESLMAYMGYDAAPLAPEGDKQPLSSLVEKLETLGSFTALENGKGGVRHGGAPGDSLRVLRTRDGLPRQIGPPLTFPPDSATLGEAVRGQLAQIARELAGKPNKIEVRGHAVTDSCGTALMYERSKAVYEELVRLGIAGERLRVTVVRETQPRRTTTDPTGLTEWVDVLILDAFASEFIGPLESTD
jgi:chemotaxis protein MotB